MIYKSNLEAPDLSRFFKHLTVSPMAHSFGHDVPRDWADKSDDDPVFGIFKQCGFWTHDEAAILYNVAQRVGGDWCDIGCHTGWTSRYIVEGVGKHVVDCGHACLDYMLALPEFSQRFRDNTNFGTTRYEWPIKSHQLFESCDKTALGRSNRWKGFCIDGDHDRPQPLRDAYNATRYIEKDGGVIMLHDFNGRPVQEAVEWLMGKGFKARIYFTPAMVACCWKGDFVPPDHIPDPNLPDLKARCPNFDWSRVQ